MATETRVFESVDSSPEAQAANAEYFKAQGIEHKVEGVPGTGTAANPPAEPPAGAPPSSGEGQGADEQVDAETAAEWDSAQTDGKRKSKYAKKRQEARELKASNEQLQTKTQQLERELAELKAKQSPPAAGDQPKPSEGTPPAGQPPAESKAAETAAPKFEEAEPVEPKYEDFEAEDDQLLAYQQALAKHTREWTRWDRKREKFEEQQATLRAEQTQKANQARDERLAKLNESLTEIRKTHADFDETVKNGDIFTPALSGASTVVPGGLEAAYKLAKDPAKLAQFNELTKETQLVNGKPVPTQRAWDMALYLLGQVNAAAPVSAPAGSPPAAAPPAQPPREEPAAPRNARGRATDEPGLDQLSGDARRDKLAQMHSV